MTDINPQAKDLNQVIQTQSPAVSDLLSHKGKRIFFPAKGILAQGQEAKGKEINATLGTATTDDNTPLVLSSVEENISIPSREAFPYAPSIGIKELRHKWKEMLCEKSPGICNGLTSLPVVTCALTHGLSMVGYMFVDPGDEIIHANLFWGNYKLVFANAHEAKLKPFNFFKDNTFDIDSFRSVLNEGSVGKKIVLLNFPNNPSGYTPTEESFDLIRDALKESAQAGNKLVVIMDDAYFGLVYQEAYEESFFSKVLDLHENILAVKVDGVTKEEYAWGLRVGFVTYAVKNGSKELYDALEAKTAGAIRGSISNTSHLSQSLVLRSFSSPNYQAEKDANFKLLKTRFEKVVQILADHDEYKEYFEALPFNSGYFMCVRLKGLDAEAVRKTLLDKYDTGLISINDMLRIAFSSTPTHLIEKLFDNLYRACQDVSAQA